ncbi:unnamed protein product [Periconia digitata]|uniref:Uncharacterized protein n=1 Tax=Periconia digitata TaxID=1303443 RepID=A0A9W4XT87_9PLEO|nr:unnamed protein product [Periconia digitata]
MDIHKNKNDQQSQQTPSGNVYGQQQATGLKYHPLRYLPPIGSYWNPMNGKVHTDLPIQINNYRHRDGHCGRCLLPVKDAAAHPRNKRSFHQCDAPCGFCGEGHQLGQICHHLYPTQR